jgi:hypothetical protein
LVDRKRVQDRGAEGGAEGAEGEKGEEGEEGVVGGTEEVGEEGEEAAVIAGAGITNRLSPLWQPTTNKRVRRGNGLWNQMAHQIPACGDRLSPSSKVRRRSRQTETMQRHSHDEHK